MSQLDLAQHLEQLARHVLREGIERQPLDADTFHHAVRILYNASHEEDSLRRAAAFSDGLHLFSQSLSTGSAQSVDKSKTANFYRHLPGPSKREAIDEGFQALAIQCPQCLAPELVATGRGVPLPVVCRKCGYQGNLT